MMGGRRVRGFWRFAFALYAVMLFTATHWPRLEIPPGPIPRPDLLAHFAAFGMWTILLGLSGWLDPKPESGWTARSWLIWAAACGYAALDESLQAIPIIQRDANSDDLMANWGGVTVGAGIFWLTKRLLLNRAARV